MYGGLGGKGLYANITMIPELDDILLANTTCFDRFSWCQVGGSHHGKQHKNLKPALSRSTCRVHIYPLSLSHRQSIG